MAWSRAVLTRVKQLPWPWPSSRSGQGPSRRGPSIDAKKREALELVARPQRHAGPLAHCFDVEDVVGLLRVDAAGLAQLAQALKDDVIKRPLLGLGAQSRRRIASAPVQPHV